MKASSWHNDTKSLRDTLLLGWWVLFPKAAPRQRIRTCETTVNTLTLRAFSSASSAYPVIVLHGLTRQGYGDHRLIRFCRALAAAGFIAYTPDLAALRGLDLDASDIERIVHAVRIVHERHSQKVGIIGFSLGATYGLIAASKPHARQRVQYVLSVGGYYALETVFANVFAHQTPNWYLVLAMDWRYVERLGLTPAEEAMYRDIMDHYCLREGRFPEAEQVLIRSIMEKPAQAEIWQAWRSRLPEKRALQLQGNTYLSDIEAQVLLLCSDDDPVIPASETARIAESLQRSNLCVQRSVGHLDYQRGQLPGLFRLFFRIMTLRQEAADAQTEHHQTGISG
jgi:pimeloyl-ACP methyl ester carboxylesterase